MDWTSVTKSSNIWGNDGTSCFNILTATGRTCPVEVVHSPRLTMPKEPSPIFSDNLNRLKINIIQTKFNNKGNI